MIFFWYILCIFLYILVYSVVVVAVVVVGVIGDFVARHLKYVSLAFWRSQIQDRIEFLEQK